jgi:hypothetical protein
LPMADDPQSLGPSLSHGRNKARARQRFRAALPPRGEGAGRRRR